MHAEDGARIEREWKKEWSDGRNEKHAEGGREGDRSRSPAAATALPMHSLSVSGYSAKRAGR